MCINFTELLNNNKQDRIYKCHIYDNNGSFNVICTFVHSGVNWSDNNRAQKE